MRLLLDTHTFLWFVNDSPKLSLKALHSLEGNNELLLSTVSLWEIAIKSNIGKLKLAIPYNDFIPEHLSINEIEELAITLEHLSRLESMPLRNHRDPFDRLLIAQAIVEQIPIVSADEVFDEYEITRLWN